MKGRLEEERNDWRSQKLGPIRKYLSRESLAQATDAYLRVGVGPATPASRASVRESGDAVIACVPRR